MSDGGGFWSGVRSGAADAGRQARDSLVDLAKTGYALATDPQAAARELGRLFDREPQALPDGAWRVPSGPGRADFELMNRATLAQRHPGADPGGLADEGVAAIVLRVGDLATTRAALAALPCTVSTGEIVAPAALAHGVMLVFATR